MSTVKIGSGGIVKVVVPYGSKIMVKATGTAKISYGSFPVATMPEKYTLNSTLINGTTTLGTFTSNKHIMIESVDGEIYYNIATAPYLLDGRETLTISTVSASATISMTQLLGKGLSQTTTGGAQGMTLPTAATIAAAIPELEIGEAIPVYHIATSSAGASTLSVNTGITAIGSTVATTTGANYKLTKISAAAFKLLRV